MLATASDRIWVAPVAVVGAGLLGLGLQWLVFLVLERASVRRGATLRCSVLHRLRASSRLATVSVALDIAVAVVGVHGMLGTALAHGLGIVVVGSVAWALIGLTYVFDDVAKQRYDITAADNLRARRVHTQIQVFRRVAIAGVSFLALGVVLLSFSPIRAIGASLLASAGVAGIVIGLAARPAIGNLIAGIQIAVTQPIKVDDVVVVEGHWGRIEEISLNYVTVRVWDLRRLILPISYFTLQPFENWTRQRADIVGWVHLEVDYSAPVQAIRERFHEILLESSNWDGKAWSLQVTGVGTETMQLRAMMSARDSSASWDLQCEVRERLVDFLRTEHPSALPRLRTEPGTGRS